MGEQPVVEPLRVAFYSHDSQGLGHFRRNRALAHALARSLPALNGRPVTGLLINGVGDVTGQGLPPGFDVVTLPAVGKNSAGYGARHLEMDLDGLTMVRGEIVRATLLAFRPDLVVVDRHALGVRTELTAALHDLRLHVPDARVVLGLREVLDTPEALAPEWAGTPPSLVRALYDEIWVYGDPAVHDLRRTGELPALLHDMVRYQGYLAHGRTEDPGAPEPEQPYLLTTAGGGSDGARLCLAAAAAPVPAGHRHLVITGPQMSDVDHDRVCRAATGPTRVVRCVPDAAGLIARAAAAISMAGYNTVAETLSTDVPALLVPRERPRREQLVRARGLAGVGATDILRERDLTPDGLGRWWEAVVTTRTTRHHLSLDGLTRIVQAAHRLTVPSTTVPSTTEEVFPVAG